MFRERWADLAKLIAIFFMVWAHIGIESSIQHFIHVFHMPLFFFVSGFFEKGKDNSIYFSLKKSFKTLLIPYFCFSIFSILYCWNFPYRHPDLYPGIENILDFFIAVFKGLIFMDDSVSYRYFMPNFALWFLVALFINKILFAFCNKILYNNKYQILMWIGIIVLSLSTFSLLSTVKYYSIDSAIMGFSLYVTGYLVNHYGVLRFIKPISWIVLLISIGYTIFFATSNGIIDMDGGVYGNSIIMFYINAIIGILMVLSFSMLVSKILKDENNILYFLGRNTLIVLGLHGFFIQILKVVFVLLKIPLVYYTTFIMAVMVLILCIPAIHLIRNKFPFMIGLLKK